jgi:uncharacterized protein (DUF433 family)
MSERITFNPNQCGGRPCIRGTRIRVKDVLDLLAAKVPESEILEDFPYLEPEDIAACLEYAAEAAEGRREDFEAFLAAVPDAEPGDTDRVV